MEQNRNSREKVLLYLKQAYLENRTTEDYIAFLDCFLDSQLLDGSITIDGNLYLFSAMSEVVPPVQQGNTWTRVSGEDAVERVLESDVISGIILDAFTGRVEMGGRMLRDLKLITEKGHIEA